MSEEDQNQTKKEFENAASSVKTGFVTEMVGFLKDNKRWWLTPIIVVLLLLGLLLVLGGTGAAPFIYTLF